MDREVILAVLGAVFGTALISGYYFSGAPTGDATAGETAASEAATFAPDDVRYPLQQEEKRAREKAKKRKVQAPAPDNSSGNDFSDGTSDDSEIEQPPAEEPSIE